MAIKQITPDEAHRRIQEGCRYVDVRSEGEFAAGHPSGAVNIPLASPPPGGGPMQPNPDFVRVMRAYAAADEPLIVGCLSGGRSQRAAELLAAEGYSDLSNMQGGFGGLRDQTGRDVHPGWTQCKLPVCRECGEENTYAALKAAVAAKS